MPRVTTRATSRVASLHLSTAPVSFGALEADLAIGLGPEASHAGERGALAAAQFGENIVNHAIQTVGGLGLGHAGLAGQVFGNFRLFHPGSTLADASGAFGARRSG